MNKKNKDQRGIDYDYQPYHRRWCGSTCCHSFKNLVGGAFSTTKKEMQIALELKNRKAKAKKQQLAAQAVVKR